MSRRAFAAALAGGCVVVVLVAALAARGPRAVSPRPAVKPAVALAPVVVAPGRAQSNALDVVSPRLSHLAGVSAGAFSGRRPRVRLLTTVADGGSGVARLSLVANGRRLAAAAAPCRRACPFIARFRFQFRLPRLAQPVALALVAADGAGNRALLWQRLLTPAKRPARARLTATFAGRPATKLTLPRGAPYALRGRLTPPARSALKPRRVQVLAVARTASARPRTVASTTTDTAGRWATRRLRARRGELLIARDATSRSIASSRALKLAVRSPLSARRLVGRVVGRLGPGARGVSVVLARRFAGRWRALARARAGLAGRYRLRVPPATRRGRLAVFAGESADWPFRPASRLLGRAR